MRAPRAGRWGQDGKELGGGVERGQGGREGGRPSADPSVPSLSHAIPMSTPLRMCTCKEEQVPAPTPTPGAKVGALRHPWVPHGHLLLSHLTQVPLPSSPCTLWPALQGWCQLRGGELLHCIS